MMLQMQSMIIWAVVKLKALMFISTYIKLQYTLVDDCKLLSVAQTEAGLRYFIENLRF